MDRLQPVLKWAGIGAHRASAALSSATLWLVAFAVSGSSSLVAGVYHLAGLGWAQVVAGLLLIAMAAYVLRGLNG